MTKNVMFLILTTIASMTFADNLTGSVGPVTFSTGCRTADPDFPGFGKTLHLVGGTLSFNENSIAQYDNIHGFSCTGKYSLRDAMDGTEPVVMLKIDFSCTSGHNFYVDIMTPPVSTKNPKLKGRFFAIERSFYMESDIDKAFNCNKTSYQTFNILEK